MVYCNLIWRISLENERGDKQSKLYKKHIYIASKPSVGDSIRFFAGEVRTESIVEKIAMAENSGEIELYVKDSHYSNTREYNKIYEAIFLDKKWVQIGV